jgi:hypothetical protein
VKVIRAGGAVTAAGVALVLILFFGTEPGHHAAAYLFALGTVLLGAVVAGVGLALARRSLPRWVQVAGWLAVLLVSSSTSALLVAALLVSGLPAAG